MAAAAKYHRVCVMGKTINLSAQGQPQVSLDLARLAVIEFSHNARHMLVRYSDGDCVRFENEQSPFDVARIARMVQVNATGFEVCDNKTIIGLKKVRYVISENPDADGNVVLTLGVDGQQRLDMVVSAAAAANIVDRMARERPTLNCQLSDQRKMYMFPSALLYAQYSYNSTGVTMHFGDAGSIQVTPVATESGFLTSQWNNTMQAMFKAHECGLCAGVVERLSFQNDRLELARYADGVAVIARDAVKTVMQRDDSDAQPVAVVHLARGCASETLVLPFETQAARAQVVTALAPAKPVMASSPAFMKL